MRAFQKDFFRRNIRKLFLERAHFREQTQIFIAGETVCSQTNVASNLPQLLKLKRRMSEILVTPRAMNDREIFRDFRQQAKIISRDIVQMHQQVGSIALNRPRQKVVDWRAPTAIAHVATHFFQELEKRSLSLPN